MSTLAIVFIAVSQAYNLPPGLLSALCYVESKHVAHAVNLDDRGSSSLGICQLKYTTAISLGFRGSPTDLVLDPERNIRLAGAYLRYQLSRYHGDVYHAVAAYNAGSWRVNEFGLTKNRDYVHKVIKAWVDKR